MKAICGIYKIEHCESGMVYIGQSIDIKKRWREHSMGEGNGLLARAVRAYGWVVFTATILLECPREELDAHEIAFIKSMKSQFPGGYNLQDGGQGALSAEERASKEAAKLERLWETNPTRAMAIVEQMRWHALTPEEQNAELRAERKAKRVAREIEQEKRRIAAEFRNAETMAEVNFCRREKFAISQADFAYGYCTDNAEKEKTAEAIQFAIDRFEFAAEYARDAADFASSWVTERAKWTAEEIGWAGERQEWAAKVIFWSIEATKLSAKVVEWETVAESLQDSAKIQPTSS